MRRIGTKPITPTKKRTPAQELHDAVKLKMGGIVLGQGSDGGNITAAHVMWQLTFLTSDDAAAAKKAVEKELKDIEKVLSKPSALRGNEAALVEKLANALNGYAGVLTSLCAQLPTGAWSPQDTEVVGKIANQAPAIVQAIAAAAAEQAAQAASRSGPG